MWYNVWLSTVLYCVVEYCDRVCGWVLWYTVWLSTVIYCVAEYCDIVFDWTLNDIDALLGRVHNVESILRMFYLTRCKPTKAIIRIWITFPSWEANRLRASCENFHRLWNSYHYYIRSTGHCSEPVKSNLHLNITLKTTPYIHLLLFHVRFFLLSGFATKRICTNFWSPRYMFRSLIFCWLSCLFFHRTWPTVTPQTLLPASCDRNNNRLHRFLGTRANFIRIDGRQSDAAVFVTSGRRWLLKSKPLNKFSTYVSEW